MQRTDLMNNLPGGRINVNIQVEHRILFGKVYKQEVCKSV